MRTQKADLTGELTALQRSMSPYLVGRGFAGPSAKPTFTLIPSVLSFGPSGLETEGP